MSSHNAVPVPTRPNTKKVFMPIGGRLWLIFKFIEYMLIIGCFMMVILTQYLNVVVDDFTTVKTKNMTKPRENTTTVSNYQFASNKLATKSRRANEVPKIAIQSKESSETSNPIKLKNEQLESELMNGETNVPINENLKRVKKVSEEEKLKKEINREAEPINLSDLLIMFPCCMTLNMVIAMEILGETCKDPLSKMSNLILNFLAILLGITLFTVSLLAFLRTPHATMILTSILSAFLIVVELINFILLQLS